MDLEELTKHQILLLTLLVSFVTSIATGIVTVTLMDQAPEGVTRTINNVIEKTIEITAPEERQVASVVERETVIVQETELTGVIEKGTRSLVRIYAETDLTNGEQLAGEKAIFKGLGVVVHKSGIIMTDKDVVREGKIHSAVISLDGGKTHAAYPLEPLPDRSTENFAALAIRGEKDEKLPMFPAISFASSEDMKLGARVVALSGESRDIVTSGIVTELVERKPALVSASSKSGETEASTIDVLPTSYDIRANVDGGVLVGGSPLFNIDGEIMGLFVKDGSGYTFKTAGREVQYTSSATDIEVVVDGAESEVLE